MELRTDDGRTAMSRAGRLLFWAILATVIVGGVAAAFWFGPGLTPLLDTL